MVKIYRLSLINKIQKIKFFSLEYKDLNDYPKNIKNKNEVKKYE